jgi:hypothetical protein
MEEWGLHTRCDIDRQAGETDCLKDAASEGEICPVINNLGFTINEMDVLS